MEVFILFGCMGYEGNELLGVYYTTADAEFAKNEHERKAKENRTEYAGYEIERRVIGARAAANWEM